MIETIDDPVFKTIELRSRPFGKGLGGGGGKYIPGHNLPNRDNRINGIQIIKNRSKSTTYNRDPQNLRTPYNYRKDYSIEGCDPYMYSPPFSHNTNGFLVDQVTAPHDSIGASLMVDKRDKLMKKLNKQLDIDKSQLHRSYLLANPAKKIRQKIDISKVTQGMLIGEFESFKNWDTRVGINENLADTRNKAFLLGYSPD